MRYVSFGALFCQYDDLIHLRRKAEYKARGGACADRGALKGGPGGKAVPKDVALLRDTSRDVRVPVPPGTFVRTAGGQPLADLLRVGQSVVVATGGEGGHSYRRLSKEGAKKREVRTTNLHVIQIPSVATDCKC